MIFKLAFRNIFRNRRRTLITIILIAFGLACLMLTDGLIMGMKTKMIHLSTRTFLGEAQVHDKDFRKTMDVGLYVDDIDRVEKILSSSPDVNAYSKRVVSGGMLSSAYNVTGVILYGFDPMLEANVSQIKDRIFEGNFLTGQSATEIIIGKKLADLLEVQLGDRVVLTVAQEKGDLSQNLFRVSGIFEFGSRQMDRGIVFVNLKSAQNLVGVEKKVHEVAFMFSEPSTKASEQKILEELSFNGNEALGWSDLLPQVKSILDMTQYSISITAGILFALVALGIINSMFMSIYERMYEFGVVKAIGTRSFQIFRLITVEASIIGLLSALLGILLGLGLNYWFSVKGIYMGDFEFSSVTINEPIHTEFRLEQFVDYPIWIFLLTIVSSFYPAFFASKLVPAEAMRKSL